MKKMVITILAVLGVMVVVTRLPRVAAAALLRGTGTVVREQKAWIRVTPEEQR